MDGAHPFRAGAAFELDGVAPDDEDNMLGRRFPYAEPARMLPPKIRLQTYQKLPQRLREAFESVFVRQAVITPAAWSELLAQARTELSAKPQAAAKPAAQGPPQGGGASCGRKARPHRR